MTGLFGEIKEEKKRVQSTRNLEPEIIEFLKTTKRERAKLVDLCNALKLKVGHYVLQCCLNAMRQREQLTYDSVNMDWILVRRIV